jgi:hypothetical protein
MGYVITVNSYTITDTEMGSLCHGNPQKRLRKAGANEEANGLRSKTPTLPRAFSDYRPDEQSASHFCR